MNSLKILTQILVAGSLCTAGSAWAADPANLYAAQFLSLSTSDVGGDVNGKHYLKVTFVGFRNRYGVWMDGNPKFQKWEKSIDEKTYKGALVADCVEGKSGYTAKTLYFAYKFNGNSASPYLRLQYKNLEGTVKYITLPIPTGTKHDVEKDGYRSVEWTFSEVPQLAAFKDGVYIERVAIVGGLGINAEVVDMRLDGKPAGSFRMKHKADDIAYKELVQGL